VDEFGPAIPLGFDHGHRLASARWPGFWFGQSGVLRRTDYATAHAARPRPCARKTRPQVTVGGAVTDNVKVKRGYEVVVDGKAGGMLRTELARSLPPANDVLSLMSFEQGDAKTKLVGVQCGMRVTTTARITTPPDCCWGRPADSIESGVSGVWAHTRTSEDTGYEGSSKRESFPWNLGDVHRRIADDAWHPF